jgi:ABC-type sugar transport system substrate-binding protein
MNMKIIAIAASILSLLSGTLISLTNTALNGTSALAIKDGNQDVKLRSLGISLGDLGNPFFVAMSKGAQAQAKKIGGDDVKVSVVSSGFDLNQQFNQIENFVAANTDVIVLSAVDNRAIKPAIDKARLAGKTVIAVDAAVDAEVDATISSNNLQAGEIACQYIADRLKGKGNVVILNSIPMDSIIQRVNGCQKALSKYSDIKILSKDQNAEGSRVMAQGAEKEAKKIAGDDVRVTVVSSGYDLNQQFNQIENFVAANTDVIILNAADSKGIRPAVDKARQAGKVVIAVDTGVEAKVDATVTTDNVQAGEVGCQYIADRLKGKGNMVIVNGPPGDLGNPASEWVRKGIG